MKPVRDIAREIVIREGGFVEDPDDPGGATNHGVTLGTLRRLGLDLDGDGVVGRKDLHRLTAEDAADIFLHHYYEAPGIDGLPQALQPVVFDMQVNAGANAVKILQRLLRQMGHDVVVDGVIGPQTTEAADAAARAAPDLIADAYAIARRSYYLRLADSRPALRKFARRRDGGKGGWILRAESFLSPRFHMSDADFQERVKTWG